MANPITSGMKYVLNRFLPSIMVGLGVSIVSFGILQSVIGEAQISLSISILIFILTTFTVILALANWLKVGGFNG